MCLLLFCLPSDTFIADLLEHFIVQGLYQKAVGKFTAKLHNQLPPSFSLGAIFVSKVDRHRSYLVLEALKKKNSNKEGIGRIDEEYHNTENR